MLTQKRRTTKKTRTQVQREDAAYSAQHGKLTFTYNQWREALLSKTKNSQSKWQSFFGTHTYNDPHTLMLHCIYMMLEHMLFKMANSDFDANTAAFIDKAFTQALEEADLQAWQMSKKKIETGLRS
jgi:hypothetical protein